ncbi:ABC-type cobalt transport system permease component CbiQ-related transporter [Rubrobacter radiotolerans]|uniref:ABC-type cobalt transport system permease component CbiQ-related transporter n=1 Tax=Rubrobacter radiotolerans TaxID=42256 RepID=A0A023X545_RUBRA|nr:ABC-type cobalt transport system permease component CbiQ-related transporter [Rubrobacter radiotolerans]SMC06344.1 energy-coupling factor transport system permease protein [Rubrobacter radiotolerans DSM 5868]
MVRGVGQFYPGESALHGLDPRAKIVASVALVVGVFLVGSVWGFLFFAGFIALMVRVSGVPVRRFLAFLRPVLFIIALTIFFQVLFSREGNLLFELGFVRIFDGGLATGAYLAARIVVLVMSAALLTATTAPVNLTDGIEDLLSPLKRFRFPAHEVAMMMTITLRFIPTLDEEAQKIMRAQAARGAEFSEGGLIRRARALVPILIPLTVGAFRRADELAEAMESRGYRGGEGRTRYRELAFRRRDVLTLAVVAAVIVAAALL